MGDVRRICEHCTDRTGERSANHRLIQRHRVSLCALSPMLNLFAESGDETGSRLITASLRLFPVKLTVHSVARFYQSVAGVILPSLWPDRSSNRYRHHRCLRPGTTTTISLSVKRLAVADSMCWMTVSGSRRRRGCISLVSGWRGYLNNVALTDRCLLPSSTPLEAGGYKTGDLV